MIKLKIVMDGGGSYLGMEKGCFVVKDRSGKMEKYPLFESDIDEVILTSGNMISTGALTSLGFWGIDVLILTHRGNPVAYLKSLDDDSHVKTRICQYEAFNSNKGFYIAKQIVLSKAEGQNMILKKYGLKPHSDIKPSVDNVKSSNYRKSYISIEGHYTKNYFKQILKLFPEKVRPKSRKKFKAYDGINNIFNLAYKMLSWKIHRAIIKAKLEPYLGFLHSIQHGKPSLVCDFQEIYRYLIDDFVIQYCQKITKKDFVVKEETVTRKKKGKREYLNDVKTNIMIRELNKYFESYIEIPRIKVGKKSSIETLINEEALLFAKFLRDERKTWIPRVTA